MSSLTRRALIDFEWAWRLRGVGLTGKHAVCLRIYPVASLIVSPSAIKVRANGRSAIGGSAYAVTLVLNRE